MIKVILLFFYSATAFANFNFYKDLSLKPVDIETLKETLTKEIFSHDGWPEELVYDERKYAVKYTFNDELSKYIKKQLRYYRSDYASVVVIDNNNGHILSAVDYTRGTKSFGKNLTFSSTNPAASVFKVITAADLVENAEMSSDSVFTYRGKSTTLYKYQLKDKKTKWTRQVPFGRAFASSNNVVFAKAAMKNSNLNRLSKMANKFGFNKDILQFINSGNSTLYQEQSDYALAELASGFNRETMMSPVHGATIASIVANDGLFKKPTLIAEIEELEYNREIWKPKFEIERILRKSSAQSIQKMMKRTVTRGTARSAFRPWKIKRIKDIEIGGKTGTITGGLPHGKRDWFVSYAVPQEEQDKGISVCVMIVNVKKWYVKSTVLAKKIIEHYYTSIKE